VRPVREKKRTNHYDPAKEAAKQQWKKAKKSEDKKPEVKKPEGPVHFKMLLTDGRMVGFKEWVDGWLAGYVGGV
jgi:hypothetical protein